MLLRNHSICFLFTSFSFVTKLREIKGKEKEEEKEEKKTYVYGTRSPHSMQLGGLISMLRRSTTYNL